MQKKSRKLELHSQNNGSLKMAFFLYKFNGAIFILYNYSLLLRSIRVFMDLKNDIHRSL